MATAIITGASRGLGQALAHTLARDGWSLVLDARTAADLDRAAEAVRADLAPGARVAALAGDITDPGHRQDVVAAAFDLGHLELLVNNASTLGASPLPTLIDHPVTRFAEVLATNTTAPLALVQEAAPLLELAARPRVVNITSDAAVEAYPGWGGYGASKAALDHLSAVLAEERPRWRVWAVDPGDLRTRMHQDAFPGEDISDRPEPATVTPALLALVTSDRPSGRVRLADLAAAELRP